MRWAHQSPPVVVRIMARGEVIVQGMLHQTGRRLGHDPRIDVPQSDGLRHGSCSQRAEKTVKIL